MSPCLRQPMFINHVRAVATGWGPSWPIVWGEAAINTSFQPSNQIPDANRSIAYVNRRPCFLAFWIE